MFKSHEALCREGASYSEGVSLWELLVAIWQKKLLVMSAATIFSAGVVFYAISIPDRFRSSIILVASSSQSDGLSGLMAQYGGLAAMAGIELNGGESQVENALTLLESWPFWDDLVSKHNLKPVLMAVEGWNPETKELIYDSEIYDETLGNWRSSDVTGESFEPTSYEVYKASKDILIVSYDKSSGLVTLEVEHYSPVSAQWLVNLLVVELNQAFQAKDLVASKRNISFLEQKAQEVNIAHMKTVFFNLIETEMKKLMLAEVSDEYLFKVVVRSMIAQEKHSPRRAMICILGGIAGGGGGIILAIAPLIFSRSVRE